MTNFRGLAVILSLPAPTLPLPATHATLGAPEAELTPGEKRARSIHNAYPAQARPAACGDSRRRVSAFLRRRDGAPPCGARSSDGAGGSRSAAGVRRAARGDRRRLAHLLAGYGRGLCDRRAGRTPSHVYRVVQPL